MARGPDEELQAKVAMEILRMCGMYAPTKVQLDVSNKRHMWRLQATEGDPKLADLIRAQEYTREMKQRGELRMSRGSSKKLASKMLTRQIGLTL